MDKNSAMTLQNKISWYNLSLGLKDQTKNVSFEFWTRSKFSLPAEGPGGVTTHPGDPTQATLIQVTHTGVHLYGWAPFQINMTLEVW